MGKWTKESALRELKYLLAEASKLQAGFSEQHTQWVIRTLEFLEEIFGRNSRYYLSFASLKWQHTGLAIVGGPLFPEESWNPQVGFRRLNQEAFQQDLEIALGLLNAAHKRLERFEIDSVYEGKDTPPESSALIRIINLAELGLRKVMRNKPVREKEVQDAFENLLIGAGIDYSKEKDSIEYSSKTYIPDFNFPKIDLILEIKLCHTKAREKEIIAEINDDILAYRTKYGNLFFVIYDTGFIRDIDRFSTEFEKQNSVIVRVVKH